MSDEPTLGELARRIDQMSRDIREDIAGINARIDRVVSADVYAADRRALEQRLGAIEKQQEQSKAEQDKTEERRATDRRLIITAFVIPFGLVILQLYLAAKGVK